MRSNKQPRFLIIRFAPGSAGRFLASMLMGSESIAHFDPSITNLNDKMEYIKNSFTHDMGSWLVTEPNDKEAWNMFFVSSKYQRGEELDCDQFKELTEQHCTDHYHDSVNRGKIIIVPWHKLNIPKFYEGDIITVRLDKESRRWFHKALWNKHFGKKNGLIHLKENDPDCVRAPAAKLIRQFNNPTFIDDNCRTFARKMITDSIFVRQFSDLDLLQSIKQHPIIQLSDLLEETKFLVVMDTLVKKLNLNEIDKTYLVNGFRHWRGCHGF